MHFVPSGPQSWFNLPRDGGVAYAAQESWVMNTTIEENIIFGSPFNQERYEKVIYQCGLTRGLTLFEAGDETEVGRRPSPPLFPQCVRRFCDLSSPGTNTNPRYADLV